jgi:hypothetical protein
MKQSYAEPRVIRDQMPRAHSAPPAAMGYLWSRRGQLKEAWDVMRAFGAWKGAAISPDHGGICLSLDGMTLGHLRWNGRIELPFGPKVADELLALEMATRDPSHADPGRLVIDIRTAADVDRAIWLLRLAYLIEDPQSVPTCNSQFAIAHE